MVSHFLGTLRLGSIQGLTSAIEPAVGRFLRAHSAWRPATSFGMLTLGRSDDESSGEAYSAGPVMCKRRTQTCLPWDDRYLRERMEEALLADMMMMDSIEVLGKEYM